MSDEAIRRLERRARQGDEHAAARSLVTRVRSGLISGRAVELLAYLAYPPAEALMEDRPVCSCGVHRGTGYRRKRDESLHSRRCPLYPEPFEQPKILRRRPKGIRGWALGLGLYHGREVAIRASLALAQALLRDGAVFLWKQEAEQAAFAVESAMRVFEAPGRASRKELAEWCSQLCTGPNGVRMRPRLELYVFVCTAQAVTIGRTLPVGGGPLSDRPVVHSREAAEYEAAYKAGWAIVEGARSLGDGAALRIMWDAIVPWVLGGGGPPPRRSRHA